MWQLLFFLGWSHAYTIIGVKNLNETSISTGELSLNNSQCFTFVMDTPVYFNFQISGKTSLDYFKAFMQNSPDYARLKDGLTTPQYMNSFSCVSERTMQCGVVVDYVLVPDQGDGAYYSICSANSIVSNIVFTLKVKYDAIKPSVLAGIIAGSTVGGLILIGGVAFYIYRRRKRHTEGVVTLPSVRENIPTATI